MVFFCAWVAFWVYFKVGRGRTRVLLINDDRVLVMKQWISPGKWNLPGGGLHKGEDPKVGAARELREETSLQLDPRQLRFIGEGVYRKGGHCFSYSVFIAKVGSDAVRAQRIEVSELAWLRPGELRHKNASPEVLAALQMARDTGVLLQ